MAEDTQLEEHQHRTGRHFGGESLGLVFGIMHFMHAVGTCMLLAHVFASCNMVIVTKQGLGFLG